MVDAGGAIDVEKTPATPAEVAVATLLTLERDGKKFHELREHAREILAAASEAPSSSGGVPAFVVRCIELVLTTRRRLRRRRESDDAKREGDECDGDASAEDLALGGADPMVHLLLECAPRVSGAGASRETVDAKTLAGGVARARRQRYVDRGDRHAAVPLLTRAMAAGAADRATTTVVAVDASLGALEPRAVIRLAETYGLDFDDVVDALAPGGATAADVRELMNAYVDALFEAGRCVLLAPVPIRPRWRGERRSLRTLPGVTALPPLVFNPRPRRLSTPPRRRFQARPGDAADRLFPSRDARDARRDRRARARVAV
jgi:hypothetical protein